MIGGSCEHRQSRSQRRALIAGVVRTAGIYGSGLERPNTMRIAGLALTALALIAAAPPPASNKQIALTIDGASRAMRLTMGALAAMPRTTVSWTVHGRTVSCAGPWLTDVLAGAGAPTGEAVRGVELTRIVIATGADGYRVAFTLGELDHRLGNAPVIVADQCDSKPLSDADGPLRLVAAADQRGARSVRRLVRLSFVQPPPPPASNL